MSIYRRVCRLPGRVAARRLSQQGGEVPGTELELSMVWLPLTHGEQLRPPARGNIARMLVVTQPRKVI